MQNRKAPGSRRMDRGARLALVLWMGMAACLAQAAPLKFRSANFKYVVDGKPIREVLRDFGASQGMVVAVAPEVEGSVVGKFDLTPRQFIDLLALSYGFVYYYNGAVLHVSASQGMHSTLVQLSYARVRQLRETLERMNVSEPRFPIVYDEIANTALVVGPQEYVDVIREISIQLEKRTRTGGRSVTRIFPLRYTRAADRPGTDGEVQPGIASLLQELYNKGGQGNSGAGASLLRSERSLSDRVAPALGSAQQESPVDTGSLALRRTFNIQPKPATAATTGGAPAGSGAGTSGFAPTAPAPLAGASEQEEREDESLPVILPDADGNNIVVRDLPERMPAYEALIASLDTQPRMIEIAVQIIDIDDSALREVGVDWNLSSRHLLGGSASSIATKATEGGLLTAIIGNSGQALLTRIAALEQQGQARISSQPRVATLNNIAAVMSSEKTFYVKVPGYQSSSLYNVSAGLDMKVTPTATREADGYRIRLEVRIDDGQVSTTETVDSLPTVSRSQIGTQAFVRQDESLLLAGHTVERTEERNSGVPLLQDLPVVGAAFRQKSVSRNRTERLFLVTPRVLD
ncbi:EscC/YscC/HrcC family type III secretion system outer membrane ring protein [Xylophilus rhododendri]|uniref:Type 3 secretion system secretin n=1 Tax=Xylophilus rhododendri TaxID=2697032 RepID=A0A857J8H4_9BURK|nr:type III secretion system outer membrane ring subunit SctC [Xylophilus rhododendri]QHJ00018.1 EscC/YscC/HrcC family type III secretion system outer membrane ring protein [Xylophilus rhododendri]